MSHVASSASNKQPYLAVTGGDSNAVRISFYYTTSDSIGGHERHDLDSYLALVRRKVQEKFATTLELITHIRKNRNSAAGHVTPNEFRYTLIKFGVILPPAMSDEIFRIFDTDRSGSINFDEFAMWVMNSEFKPKDKHVQNSRPREELLREKFAKWAAKHPDLVRGQLNSPKIPFSKFFEAINRKFSRMTEPEVRDLFAILDPHRTGYVDGEVAMNWINTGRVEKPVKPPVPVRTIPVVPLEEAIAHICGKNLHQLEWCFLTAEKDPTKWHMPFEEFVRNLAEGGLVHNGDYVKSLFMALGGEARGSGTADIRKLLQTLTPLQELYAQEKSRRLTGAGAGGTVTRPTSAKLMTDEAARLSRMDRYLRETMRKVNDLVFNELDSLDPTGKGFVDSEVLRAVVVRFCCPIAPRDFEYIIREIRKDPSDPRMISWTHFVQVYGVRAAPHELQGPGFTQAALLKRRADLVANPNADHRAFLPRPTHAAPVSKSRPKSASSAMSGHSLPFVYTNGNPTDNGTSNNEFEAFEHGQGHGRGPGQAQGQGLLERPRSAFVPTEVRQRPHSAGALGAGPGLESLLGRGPSPGAGRGPDLGKSFSVQSLSSSLTAGTAEGGLAQGGGLAATRQRIADTRAKLQASFSAMNLNSTGGGSGSSATGAGGTEVGGAGGAGGPPRHTTKDGRETESERDVRCTWAAVLKDCHRSDPEGMGCVTREEFLYALMNGNLRETLDEYGMEELASRYAIPGSEGRMVDYLLCFKTYLLEAAGKFVPSDLQLASEASKRDEHAKPGRKPGGLKHPWDFDYKREKNSSPYWLKASAPKADTLGSGPGAMPSRSVQASQDRRASELASTENTLRRASNAARSVKYLTSSERDLLVGQYDKDVYEMCAKCYTILRPSWKDVRNDFKRNQIQSFRGHIVNYNFANVLKKYGVVLSVWEQPKLAHAFRVKGMHGVVNFDDFQRVCVLTKLRTTTGGSSASRPATSGMSGVGGGGEDSMFQVGQNQTENAS